MQWPCRICGATNRHLKWCLRPEDESKMPPDSAPVDDLPQALKDQLKGGAGNYAGPKKADIKKKLTRAHAEIKALSGTIASQHDTATVMGNRLKEQEAEIDRLKKLVYAPGLKRCAKCSFVLLSQTLHVENGAVSANDEPEVCPNGCGPLWRVTERENRVEMQTSAEELATKNNQLRTLIALLAEALKPFAARVPASALNGEKPNKTTVAMAGQELGDFRKAVEALAAHAKHLKEKQ